MNNQHFPHHPPHTALSSHMLIILCKASNLFRSIVTLPSLISPSSPVMLRVHVNDIREGDQSKGWYLEVFCILFQCLYLSVLHSLLYHASMKSLQHLYLSTTAWISMKLFLMIYLRWGWRSVRGHMWGTTSPSASCQVQDCRERKWEAMELLQEQSMSQQHCPPASWLIAGSQKKTKKWDC